MNKKQKTRHDSKARRGAIDLYAAQCSQCDKWRIITSQEEYEDLRCRFLEEPFTCDRKPNVTCDDPADVERDATRTWVIDKPNLPKTPKGFKRELIVRSDYSKLDAYYVTATGKRLRCHREVKQYLEKHTEYKHLKLEDFDFSVPKVMDETIPAQIKVKRAEKSGSKGKV